MLASLSECTLKQYKSSLDRWFQFCDSCNIDPFNPDVSMVIKFLTMRFKDGKSYSTLNTDRSVISLISPNKIGENSLIKRLLKGCFKLKPTVSKYSTTWDVNVVLDYLENLGSSSELSLKVLTFKTIMLLALITAQRAQTLAKIRLTNIKINPDKIEIAISDIVKTSRTGVSNPVLVLPKFNSRPNLCVYTAVNIYVQKTECLRASDPFLFIKLKKPHTSVGSQTISRWLKKVLADAGINKEIFSGPSTRHASTSHAFVNGVQLDCIRKTAGWSKRSIVFAKYYNKPIQTESCTSFSSRLLR